MVTITNILLFLCVFTPKTIFIDKISRMSGLPEKTYEDNQRIEMLVILSKIQKLSKLRTIIH